MKIYTRTGDDGTTGLFGGGRVPKHHARVAAYGDLDELNSALGAARAAIPGDHDEPGGAGGPGGPGGPGVPVGLHAIGERIAQVQADLLTIGAQFASTRKPPTTIRPAAIPRLEGWIDDAETALPPLQTFILPGGSLAGAMLHLARTVCRRAERSAWHLHDLMLRGEVDAGRAGAGEAVSPDALIYLNRLSDLCFVWARQANQLLGRVETPWLPEKRTSE